MQKKILLLAALLLSFSPAHSTGDTGSFFQRWPYLTATGGVVSCLTAGYFLYQWLNRSESNEEIRIRGQQLFDEAHHKYSKLALFHQEGRLKIKDEKQLFDLVGNPELVYFKSVGVDLVPFRSLKSQIKGRLESDAHAGKVDHMLRRLFDDVDKFTARMELMHSFWRTYGSFFALHADLELFTEKYKKYRNIQKKQLIDQLESDKGCELTEQDFTVFTHMTLKDRSVIADWMKVVQGSDTIMMQANGMAYELAGLAKMAEAIQLYFSLQRIDHQLYDKYKQYLHDNAFELMRQVKGEGVDGIQYPFIAKAKALAQDIPCLEKAIAAARASCELFKPEDTFSVAAIEMLNHADYLFASLTNMKNAIACSAEYKEDERRIKRDERRKKKEQREEERLRIERKKAEAEMKKAQAEQDRNRVEREKAKAAEKAAEAHLIAAAMAQKTQALQTQQAEAEAKKKNAEAIIEQSKASMPPSYEEVMKSDTSPSSR